MCLARLRVIRKTGLASCKTLQIGRARAARRNASSLRMAAGATANAAQSNLNNQLHDAAALEDVAALREAPRVPT